MKRSSLFFLTMFLCILPAVHGQEGSPLVLSHTVSFPGVQGGFNHMSVDARRMRLFAAASTNTTLEIIDLKEGKPWRSLPGEKPAAARYAPEFDQLYVTRGQSLYIYDGKTYGVIASIDLGSNLDELQYDARTRRLYVGCMSADKTGIAVISIPDGKLMGKIVLPDKPQGFVVEGAAACVGCAGSADGTGRVGECDAVGAAGTAWTECASAAGCTGATFAVAICAGG